MLWQVLWVIARDILVQIGMGNPTYIKLLKILCFTYEERGSTTFMIYHKFIAQVR